MEEERKEEKKQKIALFRFQVIAPLLGLREEQRGVKEKQLQQISSRHWEIPYSGRSYVGRSTALGWLQRYLESGQRLESLYPQRRSDRGRCRVMDEETQQMLIQLKKELGAVTVPTLLKVARERGLLPVRCTFSRQSVYRLLKEHATEQEPARKDRRRFEAELPNDLWQSDCMHGPLVEQGGRWRKSFLFAFIDDHSRLIPNAAFYLQENLENFLSCFRTALHKRGLPRKLYVDNSSCFRSHHLAHVAASLGIALIHCTPYEAQGKGKIVMRTCRPCTSILPRFLKIRKMLLSHLDPFFKRDLLRAQRIAGVHDLPQVLV
jgi:transposase InsO family protein